MSIPDQVRELVERFDKHRAAYKSGKYNETQVRREFIDPFFKALEWDVDNSQGYAEAYKDVVHEDAIKVGQATKAPDYSFRIGGIRKFFLEAKKPSVDIKHDTHPAYQLRRYGWSAKLSLSILTDFEEFAVYDCRVKPLKTDNAATARIMYLTYTDYIEHWDELQAIFSPQGIKTGSFDKYAASTKTKRGTAEVDNAFLQEIERWRDMLARNFALRNTLTQRELNYAVQLTIDRLIFLRIAEDRNIEPYGQLKALLKADNIYPNLVQLFARADDRYNSGLFHFKAEKSRATEVDSLTPNLTLDDKVLKDIFKNLYYPDSPYEFSVLPADILGQVYEQFLGKVIRLTSGGRAKVEEKPEVKKAGGVYYTPTYIVDYIVKQTVGQLFEGQQIGGTGMGPVNRLRILDPACGSGSFLLGAYQYLLDWYLEQYRQSQKKWSRGKNPRLYESSSGEWRLTIAERKRILTTHIYGVDIDPQAVEVTKLSLLLKVLEDDKSVTQQLALFQERVLPDLDENIKCGNSLIGPDYYAANPSQMGLFADEEEFYRINAFDWQAQFKEIMQAGGFDAVIGNPPYLKEANNKDLFDTVRKSETKRYCMGKMDLWYAFACISLDLLKEKGFHAFIATNNWITNYGAFILRQKFMSEAELLQFIDFSDFQVFDTASIQTMIYVVQKQSITPQYEIDYLKIQGKFTNVNEVQHLLNGESEANENSLWTKAIIDPQHEGNPFTLTDKKIYSVLKKIKIQKCKYLSGHEIGNGIDVLQDFVTKRHLPKLKGISAEPGDGIFVLNETEKEDITLTENDHLAIKAYYTTTHINRYTAIENNDYWLIYSDKTVRENIDNYPGIKQHLKKFAPVITSVYKPYGLHRSREEKFFTGNKILSIRKTRYPSFSLVEFPCYVSRAFMILDFADWEESGKYLLGVLNSEIIKFWLYHQGKKQGDQLQIDKQPLLDIPIRIIDFNNPADVAQHDKMVALVEQMLTLHQKLAGATIPRQKTMLKTQIEMTDRQIDTLVYALYGLTEEEIAIVEETAG